MVFLHTTVKLTYFANDHRRTFFDFVVKRVKGHVPMGSIMFDAAGVFVLLGQF